MATEGRKCIGYERKSRNDYREIFVHNKINKL